MRDPWEVLRAAGVPDGPPRPPSLFPESAELRAALARAIAEPAPAIAVDALWAWLRAFRQHWPKRFETVLGDAGAAAVEQLGQRSYDPNRYLKLRRIAVEQLAA